MWSTRRCTQSNGGTRDILEQVLVMITTMSLCLQVGKELLGTRSKALYTGSFQGQRVAIKVGGKQSR